MTLLTLMTLMTNMTNDIFTILDFDPKQILHPEIF